jgi:hypothetical protein
MYCLEGIFFSMLVGELVLALTTGEVLFGAFVSDAVLKVVKTLSFKVLVNVMYIGIPEERTCYCV